uniref:Uncharacterized protein n=1 Tax=Oryza sativa subsp. japonica TaxID=39947 RepID=Q5Z553_ORYSJ|nr:hypothetical protein [Oryza sativa Japonica Group]
MVGLGWLGTSWDPGSGCQFGLNHRRPWVKAEKSDVLDFCKLGCTSSVCSKINTFAANEGVNAAVERCEHACDRFCTNEAQTVTVVS